MSTIARILFLAGIGCLVCNGEASAKEKTFCYFHHNCPEDGKLPKKGPPKNYTKRQCANGGGLSWGDDPTSCENLD
ncbi:MAG: hypothetical protein ABSD11_07530 [Methylocella sp.]